MLTSYLLLGMLCFQAATSATPKDKVSRTGQKSLAFLSLTPWPYLFTCGEVAPVRAGRHTQRRPRGALAELKDVVEEGGEFAKVIATLARGTKVRFCNNRTGTSGVVAVCVGF